MTYAPEYYGGGSTSPVTPSGIESGAINRIVRGADYKVANGRAFEWTFADVGNVAVPADATCTFAGRKRNENAGSSNVWSVSGTLSQPVAGFHKATFELSASDTSTLSLGEYEWSVEVIDDSGNKIVPVLTDRQRLTRLIEKFS